MTVDLRREAHAWAVGTSNLECRRLHSASSEQFEAVFQIYEEALPASERKSRRELGAMVAHKNYRFLFGAIAERVVGFSILFLPLRHQFALLEYMAVEKSQRSKGFGGTLFRQSVATVLQELGQVSILLEVDSDREQANDFEQRVQRIRFYRREGCKRVKDLHYILPLHEHIAPPAMDIFVYQSKATSIRKPELAQWLKAIYSEVYGRARTDPRIRHMMEQLADPIVLE